MIFQKTDSECAIASLQNALSLHGVRLSRRRALRAFAYDDGTRFDPAEGADEEDLERALRALGCAWEVCDLSKPKDAYRWLWKGAQVAPILLCVDDWHHWVCVAGPCDRRACLMDPSNERVNIARGGVTWPRVDTIVRRWRAARRRIARNEGHLYYGIAIMKVGN